MIRRTSLFLIGLVLILQAFARDEYDRSFDKTLAWRAGQRISLEHKLGDIVIRTHPQPDVIIHSDIHVSASDANEAKDFADRLEIRAEQSNSEVSIRTMYPESSKLSYGHNVSYCIRYQVTIPETAPLEVRNSFGAVSVTGLRADSDIVTSHGGIEFRDGRGMHHLANSFGSITVNNNTGDMSIQTTNAGVDVRDVAGALTVRNRFAGVIAARITKGVTIMNSNGPIQLTDSAGGGEIKNSFGSVTVRNFRGHLAVNNAYGKVDATNVEGPGAEIATSFAAIVLDDVTGPLQVENKNGAVEATSAPQTCQPITIRTSFSILRVRLNGDASYRVAAKTSFGKIRTDFPLNVSQSGLNGELSGVIGAGRCEMRLTNSYGNIEILRSGTAVNASTQ